jgi:imidazolonepropionase-like amidohydrolase
MLCIKGGTIHTAITEKPFAGDLLIENGKISEIGPNLSAKATDIYDAPGFLVYPGLVEAHCHLGLDGYAIRYEGHDYNEMNDSLTPHLDPIDAFNPQDETIALALRSGVTTVGTGPGSANVLGGVFMAIKTVGDRVDDMVLKRKVAMKCAFGENPKFCYKEKGISSRMTTAAKLREALLKAQEYHDKKKFAGDDLSKRPAFDMKLEALGDVLNGSLPLKAHAHRADDIFTAIRIAREFHLGITLEHVTDGHLIAEYLAKEGIPVAIGPTLGHASKYELRNKTFETPGILANAGCKVSIITDSPFIPQQYLSLCAGLAVKSGMKPYDALRAITIQPAHHLGISERVGSLEVGKDADVLISTGDILDFSTELKAIFVNGKRIPE